MTPNSLDSINLSAIQDPKKESPLDIIAAVSTELPERSKKPDM